MKLLIQIIKKIFQTGDYLKNVDCSTSSLISANIRPLLNIRSEHRNSLQSMIQVKFGESL